MHADLRWSCCHIILAVLLREKTAAGAAIRTWQVLTLRNCKHHALKNPNIALMIVQQMWHLHDPIQ